MLDRASLSDRRRIGSYYTPKNVAEILSEWAIKTPTDLILEPSFGGCELLETSTHRLRNLGCADPNAQIFGCDLDPHAFQQLERRLGLTLISQNFFLGDFLAIAPTAYGGRYFQAVIGNPPYVRHHGLSSVQRSTARSVRDALLPQLNMQASLWAYFVLHSTQFLSEGGRMAWLLPSSFKHAYYSKPLREFLCKHFCTIRIIELQERIFRTEGAEEGTIILLAESWHRAACAPCLEKMASAASVNELSTALRDDSSMLGEAAPNLSCDLALPSARLLNEFCDISIGVVTGDSKYFLFDKHKALAHKIPARQLKFIASKSAIAAGLEISKDDLRSEFASGARVKIFNPTEPLDSASRAYIDSVSEERRQGNLTFGKRAVWYRPLDEKRADAFFAGMSHDGPRLVLNSAGVSCTNSLYRVIFLRNLSVKVRRLLAISLSTTISQLSAEMVGRTYGGGMLKHEPSEAGQIVVLAPKNQGRVAETFHAVDAFLKSGEKAEATALADEFFISLGCLTLTENQNFRRLLNEIRSKRLRQKTLAVE